MDTATNVPVVSPEIVRALTAARRMLDEVEHTAGDRGYRNRNELAGGYGRLAEAARHAEEAVFQVMLVAAVWCEEPPAIRAINNRPIAG